MSLNQSELATIIRNIFCGVVTPILEETFNLVYKYERNQVFHQRLIEEIDTTAKRDMKDMVLSRVSLHSSPIIDITVRTVTRPGKPTEYYIFGLDLRKYHMYLPKIHDKRTGKSFSPKTGPKHSKWYPFFVAKTMKNIALHLRMLDIYLKNNRIIITPEYTTSTLGILGMEVLFEVPEDFEDIVSVEDFENASNPIKRCDGIYVYGKNGVDKEITNKITTSISSSPKFSHVFSKQIINSEILLEFIKSPQTIAIGSWNRHARVLIKNDALQVVDIIDPWKRRIEIETISEFNSIASTCGWSVNFVVRCIIDQALGEGSCVLVALARLLFLASSGVIIDKSKYERPIPEFFAFLSSHFYRKTL